MSNLVQNPEDRFSHNAAHMSLSQEDQFSGFMTRLGTNRPAQLQTVTETSYRLGNLVLITRGIVLSRQ